MKLPAVQFCIKMCRARLGNDRNGLISYNLYPFHLTENCMIENPGDFIFRTTRLKLSDSGMTNYNFEYGRKN
jgi:hypothetical protein